MNDSRLKDVYPLILARKSPEQIVAFCRSNRYFHSLCTEDFWKQIILARWGNLVPLDIQYKVQYKVRYEQDMNDLIEYVVEQDLKAAQEILARGVDINRAYSLMGDTLLMEATRGGNKDMIELLLDYGADINQQRADGKTALMLAIKSGSAAFRTLLKAGADVNIVDRNGQNVLHHLMEYSTFITYMIKSLLKKGIDINAQDDNGRTALHLASAYGNLDIVKLLLQAGADPYIVSTWEWGGTALDEAQRFGKKQVVDLLSQIK